MLMHPPDPVHPLGLELLMIHACGHECELEMTTVRLFFGVRAASFSELSFKSS